jgi:hypothetical protein
MAGVETPIVLSKIVTGGRKVTAIRQRCNENTTWPKEPLYDTKKL